MDHQATIQLEFLKEARKWKDMSYEDQKGYLGRHPKSKRKITARPEGGKKTDDEKKTDESETPTGTYADFATKLADRPKTWIKDRIQKLQEKIDRRVEAAWRRERRAQGDLDGTAVEAAGERNAPLEIEQKLLKHYLEHGDKKLPPELQEEFDSHQEDRKERSKEKLEAKKGKEKYEHLVGKNITWKSRKHQGEIMTARCTKIKLGRHGGVMATTDNGWRVPVDLITKSSEPPKSEKTKELVTAKDLIGKKVSWKSKFKPGYKTVRGSFGRARYEKQPPPGYDPDTGTASGKVTGAKGSKVEVAGWRIPLTLLHEVDGKKFSIWQ